MVLSKHPSGPPKRAVRAHILVETVRWLRRQGLARVPQLPFYHPVPPRGEVLYQPAPVTPAPLKLLRASWRAGGARAEVVASPEDSR